MRKETQTKLALAVGSAVLAFCLAVGMDFALSQAGWFGLIHDPMLRVQHPIYHHSLSPGLCTWEKWGGSRYRICTNSLGYRDAEPREVGREPARPRVLFIGDSFTEGVGMPWENTFAGLFAARHPEIEVLNAGVVSYAHSVYLAKVRALLEEGYRVDHVVVFLDISDIRDEARYDIGDGDAVIRVDQPRASAWEMRVENFGKANFKALSNVTDFIDDLFSDSGLAPGILSAYCGAWTFADWEGLRPHYPPLGVAKAIDQARDRMDRLHDLLRVKGIKLSLAVYPWPGQMAFDQADSLQVRLWKDWCQGRCAHFVDGFASFFAYRDAHPADWLRDLYIDGDVHFNELGNRLLADRLEDFPWP